MITGRRTSVAGSGGGAQGGGGAPKEVGGGCLREGEGARGWRGAARVGGGEKGWLPPLAGHQMALWAKAQAQVAKVSC